MLWYLRIVCILGTNLSSFRQILINVRVFETCILCTVVSTILLFICSVLEPVRMGYGFLREGIGSLLSQITMSNMKTCYRTFRKMTYWQLFVAMLKMNFRLAFLMLTVLFHIVW